MPFTDSNYTTRRRSRSPSGSSSSISDSELLEGLDETAGFDMQGYREMRLEALKTELNANRELKVSGHGRYMEITNEKEVVQTTAREHLCVVHFYHSNFKRCEIMHRHLELLAPRHFQTRFLKVFVENIPWLVEKLQIKVLPCVICFVDGVTKDRIIGFEELGNNDTFGTELLEWRLKRAGVIQKEESQNQRSILGFPPLTSGGSRLRSRGGDDDYDIDDD